MLAGTAAGRPITLMVKVPVVPPGGGGGTGDGEGGGGGLVLLPPLEHDTARTSSNTPVIVIPVSIFICPVIPFSLVVVSLQHLIIER